MNKENYALKLVDEMILYYDARSKKHQITRNLINLIIISTLHCDTCVRCASFGQIHGMLIIFFFA